MQHLSLGRNHRKRQGACSLAELHVVVIKMKKCLSLFKSKFKAIQYTRWRQTLSCSLFSGAPSASLSLGRFGNVSVLNGLVGQEDWKCWIKEHKLIHLNHPIDAWILLLNVFLMFTVSYEGTGQKALIISTHYFRESWSVICPFIHFISHMLISCHSYLYSYSYIDKQTQGHLVFDFLWWDPDTNHEKN